MAASSLTVSRWLLAAGCYQQPVTLRHSDHGATVQFDVALWHPDPNHDKWRRYTMERQRSRAVELSWHGHSGAFLMVGDRRL